ncbi:MAG: DUF418 domain-containing protein [Stackebrandtia sp.]
MTTSDTGAKTPARGATTGAERKLTPDLARGFMLLLIAMAYAPMYVTSGDVGGYGSRPDGGAADQAVSFLAAIFLENRAFPLFGILFGYGMVMLTTRQRSAGTSEAESRRLLRRRSLWLLAFGLVHAALVFPGEILAAYGVGGLILGWLLFRPESTVRRATAVLSVYYAVVVMLGGLAMGVAMSAADGEEQAWSIPGYLSAEDWITRIAGAPVTPLMNTFFFPLLILVTLGIWIGKRRLLDSPDEHRDTLKRLAIAGISVSALGGLPLALAGAGAFDLGGGGYGLLLGVQILTGICGGVGYAAAFGLLGARLERRRGPITRALAAAGQRSLSVYLFASVGVAVVLHPDLLGVGDHVYRAGAMAIALGVWLLGVLLARWLDAAGRRGPVDALLRKLVYRGVKA